MWVVVVVTVVSQASAPVWHPGGKDDVTHSQLRRVNEHRAAGIVPDSWFTDRLLRGGGAVRVSALARGVCSPAQPQGEEEGKPYSCVSAVRADRDEGTLPVRALVDKLLVRAEGVVEARVRCLSYFLKAVPTHRKVSADRFPSDAGMVAVRPTDVRELWRSAVVGAASAGVPPGLELGEVTGGHGHAQRVHPPVGVT